MDTVRYTTTNLFAVDKYVREKVRRRWLVTGGARADRIGSYSEVRSRGIGYRVDIFGFRLRDTATLGFRRLPLRRRTPTRMRGTGRGGNCEKVMRWGRSGGRCRHIMVDGGISLCRLDASFRFSAMASLY